MIKTLVILVALSTTIHSIYSNTNILLQKEGAGQQKLIERIDTKNKKDVVALDDPFKLQLFAIVKTMSELPKQKKWVNLVLSGKYLKALQTMGDVEESASFHKNILLNTELYLLYKLGYVNAFLHRWIDSSSIVYKTELIVALSQMVAPSISSMIQNNGFYLNPNLKIKLSSTKSDDSAINITLQALSTLNQGVDSLNWIGKLETNDPLRINLAYSAILEYARKGQLGAAGEIIKKVVGPWLEKVSDINEISFYYLTLARLLYQANALNESIKFYELIPEESKYFLSAKAESLWPYLRLNDFANVRGNVASFSTGAFNDNFYPEIHLTQAMADIALCRFNSANNSITSFVKNNTYWAKKIEKEIAASTPKVISDSFNVKNLQMAITGLAKEGLKIKQNNLGNRYMAIIDNNRMNAIKELNNISRTHWMNRKIILENAIYKMQFVRIELLGNMRLINEGKQNLLANSDYVSTASAIPGKNILPIRQKNQLIFPQKRQVWWGDELFRAKAVLQYNCNATF